MVNTTDFKQRGSNVKIHIYTSRLCWVPCIIPKNTPPLDMSVSDCIQPRPQGQESQGLLQEQGKRKARCRRQNPKLWSRSTRKRVIYPTQCYSRSYSNMACLGTTPLPFSSEHLLAGKQLICQAADTQGKYGPEEGANETGWASLGNFFSQVVFLGRSGRSIASERQGKKGWAQDS